MLTSIFFIATLFIFINHTNASQHHVNQNTQSSISVSVTPIDNKKRVDTLEQRIVTIENQKEHFEKQSILLTEKTELLKQSIDNRFDKKINEIDKKDSNLSITLIFMSAMGIFGLVAIYSGLKSFIQNNVKKLINIELQKEVAKVVETNKSQIIELIKKQDLEENLKQNKKILVISETTADVSYMKSFFEEIGIKNIIYHKLENENSNQLMSTSGIDMIIFDDRRNTNKHHEFFNTIINQTPDKHETVFLFYGNRFTAENTGRLNFSNSKYTLYNQIINSLKYQYTIQQSSKFID